MATIYTELFEKECENRFGLTRNVVRDAITFPERAQKLVSQGLMIYLYLRKIASNNNDDDKVLVLASAQGPNLMVMLAFRLKQELITKTGTDEPLLLLKAIAEKFGLPIKIGTQTAKFIVNEMIPVTSYDMTKVIQMQNESDSLSSMYMRVINDSGNSRPVVQCALAFHIARKPYAQWLGYRE